MKTAQELSNALNGLDKRSMKASKVAGKSASKEVLEETEARKVLMLKQGVEQLKALQKRQEEERIYEEQKLNERLSKDKQLKNRHGGALDVVIKKGDDRYSMIYEEPEEEDRESFPIKKETRDRMGPNLAKDHLTPIDHLFSVKNFHKHAMGNQKIKLVLDPSEVLKKKKALLDEKKPPRHKHSRS